MTATQIFEDADITVTDLSEELAQLTAQGYDVETARFEIDGQGERAQALFVPAIGRGGVAWGAEAQWTDCADMSDLIERFCNDNMCM